MVISEQVARKEEQIVLSNLLEYERVRYKSKGFGILFAYLLPLFYFTLVPPLANRVYKSYYDTSTITDGKLIFWSIFLIHEGTFIFINCVFYFIYTSKLTFFEKYRVTNDPWPWEEDLKKWKTLFRHTLFILFLNQFIILPLSMVPYYTGKIIPYNTDPDNLPTLFEFFYQNIFFMFMDDLTFYWTHRLLHVDWFYPYAHKLHHKYITTIALSSEYTHPIEFSISGLTTANSGSLILGQRCHLVTYLLWMIFRVLETTDGHCGYEFSFSPFRIIPGSGSSEFHYFHHKYYKGNYSSFFMIWDCICGTVNKNYIKYFNLKKEIINGVRENIK